LGLRVMISLPARVDMDGEAGAVAPDVCLVLGGEGVYVRLSVFRLFFRTTFCRACRV